MVEPVYHTREGPRNIASVTCPVFHDGGLRSKHSFLHYLLWVNSFDPCALAPSFSRTGGPAPRRLPQGVPAAGYSAASLPGPSSSLPCNASATPHCYGGFSRLRLSEHLPQLYPSLEKPSAVDKEVLHSATGCASAISKLLAYPSGAKKSPHPTT